MTEGASVVPDWRAIASLTEAPEVAVPWLDHFYEVDEVDILLALADDALTGAELARKLRAVSPSRFARASAVLHRAYRRVVVERSAGGRYSPAPFPERFMAWALFEGWGDLSADAQAALREWRLGWRIDAVRTEIDAIVDGRPYDEDRDPTYLLLEEAEAQLREWPHIYLFPCGCRAIMRGCGKPTLNCLCRDDWHDLGWEISLRRALDIVGEANRRGLMQTGRLSNMASHSICNCCSDCCYPMQVADRLGLARQYPRSRYVAVVDASLCDGCRRCVSRCPFDAIAPDEAHPVADARDAAFVVDEARCRGCGVCATGCASDAISMQPLDLGGALIP
jgi:ferredoxin